MASISQKNVLNYFFTCIEIKWTSSPFRRRILKQIPLWNSPTPASQLPCMQLTTPQKLKGSILLAKHCPFQIKDTCIDEARYIFVKGLLFGKWVTLANIYAPNTKQVPLFRFTLQKLSSFQEGLLILGGDFNVPLNPLHDTSAGNSTMP